MDLTDFITNLLVAAAAGILIGMERQWHHKSAGLRTNALVTIGSALYVLLSIHLTLSNGDVTRIVGQVVTGIGFLGGGIIFKEGFSVHGLTTAATVWCSSAIGCLAGTGLYLETLVATVSVIGINLLLLPLDNWLSKRSKP